MNECESGSRTSGMLTERAREFLRWGIKSGIGLSINLALLTVWVDGVGIPPELAVFINWALLSVYGYVLTNRWVFEDTKPVVGARAHAKQWLGMQGILAGGKVVNYVAYVVLIHVGVEYRVSWVLGAVLGLAISFGGNRAWWRGPQTET